MYWRRKAAKLIAGVEFFTAIERRLLQLYKKLNGVDAGQTLDIIDPRLAAVAGRPVPPFKHG